MRDQGSMDPLRFTDIPSRATRRFSRPAARARTRLASTFRPVFWTALSLALAACTPDADPDRASDPEAAEKIFYGGPILKPALFEIPTLGTLGIHHGKLPAYRGKKTTFWAMFNDEPSAGVTIQSVNAGLDTGRGVRAGEGRVGLQGLDCLHHLLEVQAGQGLGWGRHGSLAG